MASNYKLTSLKPYTKQKYKHIFKWHASESRNIEDQRNRKYSMIPHKYNIQRLQKLDTIDEVQKETKNITLT